MYNHFFTERVTPNGIEYKVATIDTDYVKSYKKMDNDDLVVCVYDRSFTSISETQGIIEKNIYIEKPAFQIESWNTYNVNNKPYMNSYFFQIIVLPESSTIEEIVECVYDYVVNVQCNYDNIYISEDVSKVLNAIYNTKHISPSISTDDPIVFDIDTLTVRNYMYDENLEIMRETVRVHNLEEVKDHVDEVLYHGMKMYFEKNRINLEKSYEEYKEMISDTSSEDSSEKSDNYWNALSETI